MGKIISAVEKAAFHDPATGTTVQLNLIAPDETEITLPPIANNTSTGITFGGKDSQFTIGFFDVDGLSQLESFQDDGAGGFVPVHLSIAGEDEFVLMRENENMTIERGVGIDARNGANIHVGSLSHVGYGSNIFQKRNLIEAGAAAFNLFDDGTAIAYEFDFPIEGAILSAGADYAATGAEIAFAFYDFGGALLDTQISQTVSATGRFNYEGVIIPANTYKIQVRFDNTATVAGANITNRTIRLGLNGDYTAD